jgi:galactokinase
MTTLFVPGRLCLLGEHSDWAGALRAVDPTIAPGACLITGADQGIEATVAECPCFEITSRLPDGSVRGPFQVAMETDALSAAAASGGFFSYAAGVAAEVRRRYPVSGVRIEVRHMDLPIARGLSSSAAICVLVARAFGIVHGLRLTVEEEMDLAYRGEISAGSQCGRMDQACAYGKRLVELGFDGDRLSIDFLPVGRPIYMLVVDLMCGKNTRRILTDLHRSFSSKNDPNCAALRHALGTENLRLIQAARPALERGDARMLGELMSEAQRTFDRRVAPACPDELSAPRLHAVLSHRAVRELAWGGKGVGSQGDGAAQLVCRGPEERDRLAQELCRDASVQCLPLTIPPSAPA